VVLNVAAVQILVNACDELAVPIEGPNAALAEKVVCFFFFYFFFFFFFFFFFDWLFFVLCEV
jgi:hypothetical protein